MLLSDVCIDADGTEWILEQKETSLVYSKANRQPEEANSQDAQGVEVQRKHATRSSIRCQQN